MFAIKTFNGKQLPQPNRIYILNKGKNSGKPSRTPYTNSYVLEASTIEFANFYFYLCFALWKCRKFEYYLKGSVIDYISIDDMYVAISKYEKIVGTNQTEFFNHLKLFNTLDNKIANLQQSVNLCNQYKISLLSKYL